MRITFIVLRREDLVDIERI